MSNHVLQNLVEYSIAERIAWECNYVFKELIAWFKTDKLPDLGQLMSVFNLTLPTLNSDVTTKATFIISFHSAVKQFCIVVGSLLASGIGQAAYDNALINLRTYTNLYSVQGSSKRTGEIRYMPTCAFRWNGVIVFDRLPRQIVNRSLDFGESILTNDDATVVVTHHNNGGVVETLCVDGAANYGGANDVFLYASSGFDGANKFVRTVSSVDYLKDLWWPNVMLVNFTGFEECLFQDGGNNGIVVSNIWEDSNAAMGDSLEQNYRKLLAWKDFYIPIIHDIEVYLGRMNQSFLGL